MEGKCRRREKSWKDFAYAFPLPWQAPNARIEGGKLKMSKKSHCRLGKIRGLIPRGAGNRTWRKWLFQNRRLKKAERRLFRERPDGQRRNLLRRRHHSLEKKSNGKGRRRRLRTHDSPTNGQNVRLLGKGNLAASQWRGSYLLYRGYKRTEPF